MFPVDEINQRVQGMDFETYDVGKAFESINVIKDDISNIKKTVDTNEKSSANQFRISTIIAVAALIVSIIALFRN